MPIIEHRLYKSANQNPVYIWLESIDIGLNIEVKLHEQMTNLINIMIRRESCCSVLYANTYTTHTCGYSIIAQILQMYV